MVPAVLRSFELSSLNAMPRVAALDGPAAVAALFPRFMSTPNASNVPASEEGQGSVSQAVSVAIM